MSKPAARLTDMHVCPMSDGPKPHVGGPVMGPGVPTVLIGGIPAAVVGDLCTCAGPPDTIVMGSATVLIGGRPAARLGDQTIHGGVITVGCPTVLIGDAGGGGGGGSVGGGSWLDSLQLSLDVAGLIPGVGELADGLNALISLGRGDYVGAGLSAMAMIPFVGAGATGAKVAGKAAKGVKGVTRSLDDLNSLRGATWKEAESLIPKDWIKGPMKKGEGIKFVNPAKKGEQILLEKGWPGAKDPLHAGPYMKISRKGKVERIPLAGNPTLE